MGEERLVIIETNYTKAIDALDYIYKYQSANILQRVFFATSLKQYLEYCRLAIYRFNDEIEWLKQPDDSTHIARGLSHWTALFEAGVSVYIYARICLDLTRSLINALEFNKLDKDVKEELDKLRDNKTLKEVPPFRNIIMHPAPNQQSSGSTRYNPLENRLALEIIDVTTLQKKEIKLDPLKMTRELFNYTHQLITLANNYWHKEHESHLSC